MASSSPLTGSPIPAASDNIVDLLSVDDGILNLEKYAVLRFASTAARDAAIPTPDAGMLCIIGGGDVYVYNGTAWVRIGSTIEDWTAYTPTWAGSTTNPAIGNGSIVGRYKLADGVCTFSVKLSLGSTSTIGSGSYSVSLPVAAIAGMDFAVHADWFDLSAGRHYVGSAYIPATGTQAVRIYLEGNSVLGSAAPAAPASGDILLINGTYEY